MDKKVVLETTQNWARWCPCHNGALPVPDLTGYVCNACGKTVCVNCIYKTEKGFLCTNCVKKNKVKEITPLEPHGKISDKNNWYIKIALIFFLFLLILSISYIIFGEIIFGIAQIFVIGFIIFIFFIFIKLVLIKKEKDQTKISIEEIKKLDEKIKNYKNGL